jgi:hypothetical protein
MPRRRQKAVRNRKAQDDLSFPVPFREQAKFLELANRFLELHELDREQRDNGVLSIEQRRPSRLKKSS